MPNGGATNGPAVSICSSRSSPIRSRGPSRSCDGPHVDAQTLLLRIENAFDADDEFACEFRLDVETYVGGGDPGCRSNR